MREHKLTIETQPAPGGVPPALRVRQVPVKWPESLGRCSLGRCHSTALRDHPPEKEVPGQLTPVKSPAC